MIWLARMERLSYPRYGRLWWSLTGPLRCTCGPCLNLQRLPTRPQQHQHRQHRRQHRRPTGPLRSLSLNRKKREHQVRHPLLLLLHPCLLRTVERLHLLRQPTAQLWSSLTFAQGKSRPRAKFPHCSPGQLDDLANRSREKCKKNLKMLLSTTLCVV